MDNRARVTVGERSDEGLSTAATTSVATSVARTAATTAGGALERGPSSRAAWERNLQQSSAAGPGIAATASDVSDGVSDEQLLTLRYLTVVTDEDYRCAWRPCPELEEEPQEDQPPVGNRRSSNP